MLLHQKLDDLLSRPDDETKQALRLWQRTFLREHAQAVERKSATLDILCGSPQMLERHLPAPRGAHDQPRKHALNASTARFGDEDMRGLIERHISFLWRMQVVTQRT